MQTVIYKTALSVERAPRRFSPNDAVVLRLQQDGAIAAYVRRPTSEGGADPESAIVQVRKARPCTIETERLEAYVRAYRPTTTEEGRVAKLVEI
jgi:hypothetical protein